MDVTYKEHREAAELAKYTQTLWQSYLFDFPTSFTEVRSIDPQLLLILDDSADYVVEYQFDTDCPYGESVEEWRQAIYDAANYIQDRLKLRGSYMVGTWESRAPCSVIGTICVFLKRENKNA